MSFNNRKFSMNRSSGVPRESTQTKINRRFTMSEPTANGMFCFVLLCLRWGGGVESLANGGWMLTETNSKIHRQFRNAHEGHRSHAGLDPTRASTGVVWVGAFCFLSSCICWGQSGVVVR